MEPKVIMYIVIGVGYFIYNIYKKINAPQVESKTDEYEEDGGFESEAQPQSTGGSSYKTIDDIISDLNNHGHIQSKKEPVHAVKEVVENPERTLSELRQEKEEVERKQREVILNNASVFNTSHPENGKKSKKRKVKFDLRKAVLYRAVLERPKY